MKFKDYDMYLASGDGSLYNMLNGITTGKKGKKKVEDTENNEEQAEKVEE